jgi:quercetin dioxygenase-like cupin family protein
VHLTAEQSGSALCLLVDEPPPGLALPPHRHRGESETIRVLEGRFHLSVDGELSVLDPTTRPTSRLA